MVLPGRTMLNVVMASIAKLKLSANPANAFAGMDGTRAFGRKGAHFFCNFYLSATTGACKFAEESECNDEI